jgi:hypothetical protein
MDAALSRLAAKAMQSPLFLVRSQLEDNLAQTTIEQLIAAQTLEKADADLVKFLEDCSSSLDWALRNRVRNWQAPSALNQAVSDWLGNPQGCLKLPIANKDRFKSVSWDEEPVQVGTAEDDLVILLGREDGTNAAIVARDDGITLTYHALYLYELLNSQGEITLNNLVQSSAFA